MHYLWQKGFWLMLKVEIQAEILSLHYGQNKSARTIAKYLGLNRKSVAAALKRRTVALAPQKAQRGSMIDPFKEQMEELLKEDPFISAATIYQRTREQGFMGGVSIIRDWVSKQKALSQKPKREAFLKLVFSPGECAQVDWGEFGDVFGVGIKIHCFVMVLCYSRLIYLEFTRSEKFEEFIRCHENAFHFFGGFVPRECWYDNLTTAVTERMGSLIKFNNRFLSYMGHHSIRPHACNPARGNEKGRVEDGVKYIRSSFWAGRRFSDFEALKTQAIFWQNGIANKREHRTTRKIPILMYETEEKKAMLSMNPHPYDTAEIFTKVVNSQFHIIYESNQYSVPWTLVGLPVTVRIYAEEVKIYYRDKLVTKHVRSYKKHQIITNPKHVSGLMEIKPGQSREGWQLQAVKAIGPVLNQYLEVIRAGSRSLRNELSQLLALATIYGEVEVNLAVDELLKLGVVGIDNLDRLLKARNIQNNQKLLFPRPIQFVDAKLNRIVPAVDLRRYDTFLLEANNHEKKKEEPNP